MEGRQTWQYVDIQDRPQTMLEAYSLGLDTVKFDLFQSLSANMFFSFKLVSVNVLLYYRLFYFVHRVSLCPTLQQPVRLWTQL